MLQYKIIEQNVNDSSSKKNVLEKIYVIPSTTSYIKGLDVWYEGNKSSIGSSQERCLGNYPPT